jgi:hypothetical protein
MAILNNRDRQDHGRAVVSMKVVILVLLLGVVTLCNGFIMSPIPPKHTSLWFVMPTTKVPWSTTSDLVTATTITETLTTMTAYPSTGRYRSTKTSSSSRLFGGGFGSKSSTTASSSSGGGKKGEDQKKKKDVLIKLKPKQQWDRYLSFKNEPKIRVAVRVMGDDDMLDDEWLEVGRVRTTKKELTKLAVARQRAIIAEVSQQQ